MPQRKDRIALPPVPGIEGERCTPLMEARHFQRLMFSAACQPKQTPANLACLARAWVMVQDAIRVLRGLPLPGQLRPDLDPAQAMKALKRIRERLPVDIAGQKSVILDEPGQVPAPAKGKNPNPKAKSAPTPPEPETESPLDLPDDEPTAD